MNVYAGDGNQVVLVQDGGCQSVHTATECFVMLRQTCRNTSGSTKASSRLSAMCVSMHVVHAATSRHTCCAIPLINRSYVTVVAERTSQELHLDGTNAATSTDAFLNVTSTCSFLVHSSFTF